MKLIVSEDLWKHSYLLLETLNINAIKNAAYNIFMSYMIFHMIYSNLSKTYYEEKEQKVW